MSNDNHEAGGVISERAKDTPVTVRLGDNGERLARLEGLVQVDGGSLADQLRQAVDLYTYIRYIDPEFPQKVEAARVRVNTVLDGLIENQP